MEDRRAKVIIADPDYKYIKGFEEQLLTEFMPYVNFQIITSPEYLANYFRVHREIDILIISREFYGIFVKEHDIGNILVLEEEISFEIENDEETPVNSLMKYSDPEEIFSFIRSKIKFEDTEKESISKARPLIRERESHLIAVYSPIGGCGKSLTAYALGEKIRKLGNTAVVIGLDDVQSLSVYLENRQNADESLADALKNPGENTYWEILKNITQENVPCLLPFERPLSALGIGEEEISNLIAFIKEKKDFEYIIADLGTTLDTSNRAILASADYCILITEPNLLSCRKLEKLVMNQDLIPVNATVTIANQIHGDGMRLNQEGIFGNIAAYDTIAEAIDDPLFYRLALEITS